LRPCARRKVLSTGLPGRVRTAPGSVAGQSLSLLPATLNHSRRSESSAVAAAKRKDGMHLSRSDSSRMVIGNHDRIFEVACVRSRDALYQLLCSAVVFRAGHHASLRCWTVDAVGQHRSGSRPSGGRADKRVTIG
jgi:hypothetical protein